MYIMIRNFAYWNLQLLTKILFLFFSIPDSIGKDIEKACQGIYPLHDVFIRKVKVLKKPKFDGKACSFIELSKMFVSKFNITVTCTIQWWWVHHSPSPRNASYDWHLLLSKW